MPEEAATTQKTTIKKGQYVYATGKRKTAIAKVRLYPNGQGTIIVNDKALEKYFAVKSDVQKVYAPLKLTSLLKNFDFTILVRGGGASSQAEAVRHGISRTLQDFDETLRGQLKKEGYLTRDSRIKERKKPGLKRARKSPQWAKR